MNWAEIGAIFAGLALIEAPLIILCGAVWKWARRIDERLDKIEARSRLRRWSDPPVPRPRPGPPT